MWESLFDFPRGRLSTRNFVMFFAALLVASFGYLFATAPVVAAADVTWKDNSLTYQKRVHTGPLDTANTTGLDGVPTGAQIYQYKEKQQGPTKVHLVYFKDGEVPENTKQATYITYTLNPPNTYSAPSAPKTVTVDTTNGVENGDTEDGRINNTCTIDGIGWMVCPIMKGLAEGMDFIYERIEGFLEVQPISTSVDSPMYRIWVYTRDLANIAFVIAFMIIIYAQITTIGISNYGLKKLLPRIIVAAVLVNLSYVVCSLAVDASNIVGYGVNDMFEGVRDTVLPGSKNADTNWINVTSWVLAGGTAGVVGGIVLTSTIAGAATGLWFLLAPFLLGAALLVIVTFLILAARQAIIVILIVIAPLAFVAYLLPNTEKWFEKWRNVFFTMLVMFPAFAAVFGGAQLAGQLIIRTASSIEQVILGLGVQVAPLAITPLLLKLGGGILNRFGGIVNNAEKGLYDRYKNYNNERLSEHQARNQKKNAQMWANGDMRKRNVLRRTARRSYAKKLNREEQKESDTAYAKALYQDDDRGVKNFNPLSRNFRQSEYLHANADETRRQADALHKKTEAHHTQTWNERMDIQSENFDEKLFNQEVATRKYGDKAKLAEERMDVAYTEMKAGSNPYQSLGIEGPATAQLQAQIDDINATAESIAWEGLRKGAAEVVIKQANAKRLKLQEELRNYVGGIGGADAAARVFASAKSEVTEDYLKSVKAMGSVQEAYDLEELIKVAHSGMRPESVGGGQATEAEIDSAIQQIVTVKGNNWSYQKLKDHIADIGVEYKDGVYYEPGTDTIIDPDTAEGRRTRQQIFVDAAKNSKLAIKNLSGTDRGNLETGTFTMKSYGAGGSIVRDIRDQKINANRLAGTDIDELMHMVQVLRDDEARGTLSEESRKALQETIEFATTDPQVSAGIGVRERKMMGVISQYLEHGKTGLDTDEKVRIENTTETPVPTDYDLNTFYHKSAKYGGTIPYGPDRNTTPVSNQDPDAES